MQADKWGLVELDKLTSRTEQNWTDNWLSRLDIVDQISGQGDKHASKQES